MSRLPISCRSAILDIIHKIALTSGEYHILGGREKRSPEPTTATHLSTSNVARASSGRLSELSRAWILNSRRWIRLNPRRIFPGYLARPPSGRGELMSRGSGATILRDRNQLGAFDRIRAIREGKGKRSTFLEDSASDGPESPDPPTPPEPSRAGSRSAGCLACSRSGLRVPPLAPPAP